jgi:hypothetical protein
VRARPASTSARGPSLPLVRPVTFPPTARRLPADPLGSPCRTEFLRCMEEMVVPFAREGRLVRDAYAVLGLQRGASDAEVRAAWRDAARRTHPDVGGDAVAFRRAREAYEILIDPVQRAAHDRLLDARSDPHQGGAHRGRATTWPEDTSARRPSAPRRPASPWQARRDRRWEWMLIVANVAVVLRAIVLLRGGGVTPPRTGAFSFTLPADGVTLWVASMDLLRVPWLFLVLAAAAVALLVAELVQERSGGAPLLDAEQRSVARFVQTAVPVPLATGVALAALVIVVQLAIALLVIAAFIVGLVLVFRVLSG